MKLKATIDSIISKALLDANIPNPNLSVTKTTKKEFGDFQYNGAMGLAKKLQTNPREIATKIIAKIDSAVIEKVEIAGAGFINIWLSKEWLAQELALIIKDENLGIQKVKSKKNIVVDYSGPNMAKEMHVGHLRSTIIGDTLANLLELLGHNVIRQNHIGDWGTQFGMLIAYLEELESTNSIKENLKDLEEFYKLAKKRFDSDAAFADKAREYVTMFQSGDKHCLELWRRFIDISLEHCEEVYERLEIKLTRDDVKAESSYNAMLPSVIEKLDSESLLSLSEGAKCVFLPQNEIPLIVQKSDGGYLYATTDLAALWYRDQDLKATRILYVVDARQGEHFKQVFWVAKAANIVQEDVSLEHIAFGTMMNEQGKPFKTRDGGTFKLIDLIDEAIVRAKNTLKDKDDTQESIEQKAKIIGIGALKYADLSVNRESNYIFNWDRMLSFEGNTALYMQYAYARIQSILRRYDGLFEGDIKIESDIEHELSVTLLDFEDVLHKSANECMPSYITSYLYELATLFMRFYEQSPILKEGVEQETKISRLLLAKVTADTIKQGLAILGIKTLEKI
jgi:arginyl-tRNA synthetase